MKFITLLIFTIAFSISAFAQKPAETLATANGRSFTVQDLSPQVGEAWTKLPETLANARKELLSQEIEDVLLKAEADSQTIAVNQLIEKEVAKKVSDPTEKQIKDIYETNRSQVGDATFAEVRPQIVSFLRQEPEKKAFANYLESLKKKYKVTYGKDVNSKSFATDDFLATVGERKITYQEFIKKNGLTLYEYEANVFDTVQNSLEQVVDSALFAAEAQSLEIATSDYIAREITNKLKTYSDEETEIVQTALRKKLYPKYSVKFFTNEPKPFIQNISIDDDPILGDKNAPVTVVMFTDFQCPACSTVDPILKNVIAGYGNKVRLVIRDFPLERIHENAFQAALAANAANMQGKFGEYKELLYKNQNSLDTESLKKYAANIGLNVKKFETDMTDEKAAIEIRKDIADGNIYGVSGTPSIFVNGYKIRGLSVKSFRKAIDRALKQ